MECRLCPRNCGVDRGEGIFGFCGVGEELKIARAALHSWEEPCISGEVGSGTVFFSGCSLQCVYCQNREIAQGRWGKVISGGRLSEIFLQLQEKGAGNINLVTPTHYVPQIAAALQLAKDQGLHLPVVYNTGSYDCVDTLRMLEGLVDIYLPDLKYVDSELSRRYSKAPDYFDVASAAIGEMVRQVGEPQLEDVRMLRGVMVRHLVLPGCIRDSKAVIRYLYDTYGNRIYISILNQFTPLADPAQYPELNRRVTKREYDAVVDYAIDLGVECGFIQEGETAGESFIPPFNLEGV